MSHYDYTVIWKQSYIDYIFYFDPRKSSKIEHINFEYDSRGSKIVFLKNTNDWNQCSCCSDNKDGFYIRC